MYIGFGSDRDKKGYSVVRADLVTRAFCIFCRHENADCHRYDGHNEPEGGAKDPLSPGYKEKSKSRSKRYQSLSGQSPSSNALGDLADDENLYHGDSKSPGNNVPYWLNRSHRVPNSRRDHGTQEQISNFCPSCHFFLPDVRPKRTDSASCSGAFQEMTQIMSEILRLEDIVSKNGTKCNLWGVCRG